MNVNSAFKAYAGSILKDSKMLSSSRNVQHGNISVLTHSVMVAKYSLFLNYLFDLHCDARALVRGALLHDFFLYDWHNIPEDIARQGLHGFNHPMIAAENARKVFNISPKEYSIIVTHMWPLTFTRVPFNREGWLVCMVDKFCSILETLRIEPYSNQTVKELIFSQEKEASPIRVQDKRKIGA